MPIEDKEQVDRMIKANADIADSAVNSVMEDNKKNESDTADRLIRSNTEIADAAAAQVDRMILAHSGIADSAVASLMEENRKNNDSNAERLIKSSIELAKVTEANHNEIRIKESPTETTDRLIQANVDSASLLANKLDESNKRSDVMANKRFDFDRDATLATAVSTNKIRKLTIMSICLSFLTLIITVAFIYLSFKYAIVVRT